MTIPEKALTILESLEDFITNGKVDILKIAKTSSSRIIEIKGIGKGFLKKIAREIEKNTNISAEQWLDGKILLESEQESEILNKATDNLKKVFSDKKIGSVSNIKLENGELTYNFKPILTPDIVHMEFQPEVKESPPEVEESPSKKEINQEDVNAMQGYFFTFIGPNSLSLEVMQWLLDNIRIENLLDKIQEKVHSLGIEDRYIINNKIEEKLKETSDQKEIQLLREIAIHNKLSASKICKRFFNQGYWKASVAVWIYQDDLQIEESLSSDVQSLIEKSENRIRKLGLDIEFLMKNWVSKF